MTAAWILEVEVSDHALVRWIERVHGVDLSRYREEILAAVIDGGFDFPPPAGDAGVYIDVPERGVHIVIRGQAVATVFHSGSGEGE